MATDPVTLAAIADTGAVLAILAKFAGRIDFTASVAANTAANGAVDLAAVAGLSLLGDIAALQADLAALVADPASLATSLVSVIQGFQGSGIDFRDLSDAASGIDWASQNPPDGLYAAAITADRAALAFLLQVQGLVEAVRAATAATYDSQNAALAMRDDLSGRLDAVILLDTTSRPLRATLDALRVALVEDINVRAAALDSLVTVTPAKVMPALVLAEMLYDDPTMTADICARNAVAHPGFVPPGPLTVLAPSGPGVAP